MSQEKNKHPKNTPAQIVDSLLQSKEAQEVLSKRLNDDPEKGSILIKNSRSLSLSHQSTTIVNNVLPVDDIKELHQLNPTYAEKYFELLDKQTDNRIKLEQTAIKGTEDRANKGISSFTIISITLILAATAIFLFGNEDIAKYLFSGSFVGIPAITRIISFISAKTKKHNNLNKTKENKIEKNK